MQIHFSDVIFSLYYPMYSYNRPVNGDVGKSVSSLSKKGYLELNLLVIFELYSKSME